MTLLDTARLIVAAGKDVTAGPWSYIGQRTLWHIETDLSAKDAGIPICSIPKGSGERAVQQERLANFLMLSRQSPQIAEALIRAESLLSELIDIAADVDLYKDSTNPGCKAVNASRLYSACASARAFLADLQKETT